MVFRETLTVGIPRQKGRRISWRLTSLYGATAVFLYRRVTVFLRDSKTLAATSIN